MKKTLLIGNGINLCCANNLESLKLIDSLSEKIAKKSLEGVKYVDFFPLKFEAILSYNKHNSDEIFNWVKNRLSKLHKNNNPVYSVLKEIIVDNKTNIITTNYDFCIESQLLSISPSSLYKYRKKAKKTKNKGFTYSINDIDVFHIHGDLHHHKNICLGEIGYNKYLRSYLSTTPYSLFMPYANKIDLTIFLKTIYAPLQPFFVDDVLIVGFGLAECEKIIWTLLLMRKVLIDCGAYERADIKINDICFINAFKESDSKTNNKNPKYKKDFLEYFGIRCKNCLVDESNSYADIYVNEICQWLNN